jgi:hypothetical protein
MLYNRAGSVRNVRTCYPPITRFGGLSDEFVQTWFPISELRGLELMHQVKILAQMMSRIVKQ